MTSSNYNLLSSFVIKTIFAVLVCTSCKEPKTPKTYDAVIIGAGISGLRAAYELRDYDTLILEKSGRVGGRIDTIHHEGVDYDMGVAVGFNPFLLPANFSFQPVIEEQGPIGIRYQKETHYCDEVTDCLNQLDFSNDELSQMMHALGKEKESRFALGYKIAKSFFSVGYPGEMYHYATHVQKSVFSKHRMYHFAGGNSTLVEELKNRIKSPIMLNTKVLSVGDLGESVQIDYVLNKEKKSIYAKSVIVATPAFTAQKIIEKMDAGMRSFLNSLRYARSTVAVLGLKNTDAPKFSYIVTPDRSSSHVVQYGTSNPNTKAFYVYYGDKASRALSTESDEAILADATATVMELVDFNKENIVFSRVKRWKDGKIIASEENYKDWRSEYKRASNRVFLTGDYIIASGYERDLGMASAIQSSKIAAEAVRTLIKPVCYHVDGICLQKIPNPVIMSFISRIKPKVFGLVGGGQEVVSWMDNFDKKRLGYDFVSFYGHKDFSFLMGIEVKNIEIIGYCPFGEEISKEEFTRRIKALKQKFPGRSILIGPCVDLFEKVMNSPEKPDVLGFELFEKNFDNYLEGKYDHLIEETLKHRTDVFNFPTFPPTVNLRKLDRVLERAALQKLKVGYTIKGSRRVLHFIEATQCKR